MPKPKKRALSLAEQIAGLDDPTPVDLDPEALDTYNNNSQSESGSESDGDEDAGREHYVPVSKSKLRKALAQDDDVLGKQYEGSRISRATLNGDEEEDDGSDEDDDMLDVEEEGEEVQNGFEDSSSVEDDQDDEDDDEDKPTTRDEGSDDTELSDGNEDEDEDDEEDDDEEDEEDDDSLHHPIRREQDASKRAELRKMTNDEQQQIVARLSLATDSDARKGEAVTSQRKTFDQLLNARIRLQKALIGVNSLDAQKDTGGQDGSSQAEKDALRLWGTIGQLRLSLNASSTGDKRSFEEMALENPSTTAIWSAMNSLEVSAKKARETTLQKWSTKVRGVEQLPLNTSLSKTQPQQDSIVNYLRSQLADSERLIKKTQMPRACAPIQANQGVRIDTNIYDDVDFYQLLLKELVDQRMANSQLTSGAKARWTAAREAKTKRVVDTKASKGRKLKYTVHEKLQNFMAPENRNSWTERQADELFGSLLGRRKRAELVENEDSNEAESDEEVDPMLLFRS